MSYRIITFHRDKAIDQTDVYSIAEAREVARLIVSNCMDAFSDDREALNRYGFLDAEDQALDMDEDGGTIFLQDGTKIEVIPTSIEE